MDPIKLQFAPGLYRQGTTYQCPNGRYSDGNLIRMSEGYRRPMKGWATGLDGTLSGNPRAAHAWKDNDSLPFAAFGTHTGLYSHNGTTLDDISPTAAEGYLLEDGEELLLEDDGLMQLESGFDDGDEHTSTWTMDNFGEVLIACNDADQTIYEWTPGGGGDAVGITNAPDALACFVTPERFIMALGTDGDPRRVGWPDQETRTTWTPTSTNQAGSLTLQTPGVLMCGTGVISGSLIWTSHDIHYARYIGFPDIYSIRPAGRECGIIGRHAFVTVDQLAYWMGESAFWIWAGYAEPLPCDISDDVFTNLNTDYRSKVWGWHNPKDGEVWFFYPRVASFALEDGTDLLLEDDSPMLLEDGNTECSHAAIYCYRGEPHWNHVELARLCGFSAGIFSWPVLVTSAGAMLKHETGYTYDDGTIRFLTSGPLEINGGGDLLFIDEIIPDESTNGDCEVYFYTKEYPNDSETAHGPFSSLDRIPVEVPARQVRMSIRAASGTQDFRIGDYRAIVKPWSGF